MLRKTASLVRTPWRLVATELFARGSDARPWTLTSGERVFLRPRTTDLHGLFEVFRQRLYDLPPAVARILDELPVVVDAGANIGLVSLYLCGRCPSITIKAFEPDPYNAKVARQNLSELMRSGRVEFHEAAVGAETTTLRFAADRGMNSHQALANEVNVLDVPQLDLLTQLEGVGLLKMDIEGAEWAILHDRRWRTMAPRSVVMEWHSLHADGIVADAGQVVVQLLDAAGFEVHAEDARTPSRFVGGLWAWRRSSVDLTPQVTPD